MSLPRCSIFKSIVKDLVRLFSVTLEFMHEPLYLLKVCMKLTIHMTGTLHCRAVISEATIIGTRKSEKKAKECKQVVYVHRYIQFRRCGKQKETGRFCLNQF